MADPKKTASKSTTKKTTSNKSNTGIKPVTGKIVPVSGKIQPVSYKPSTPSKPKSTTTSKTSSSKVTDKKVVKKAAPIKKTAPKPSTSVKSTTTKPKAPKYVKPGTKEYWAMTPDQRNANTMLNIKESIAGPKKSANKAPAKKSIVNGKNVTSKEGAAKIKGIVEGLERPTTKKETTKKPVAPKMTTTIGSAKVSTPSKGKVKIEANTGKPKSFTAPKTETKKVTPKVAPKPASAPEPIKMETIPLATVANQLLDSRPKQELAGVKPATTPAVKTSAPAEEKKGLFARMKERREARKAEREAEKRGSAGNAVAMKKGGTVKYKKGGSIKKTKKK